MIQEFKDFIARGNVIDLAVGVIIGSAFGKIVSSLVDDVIMPLIGIVLGGIDFTTLSITVEDANITYGNFIQNTIDFLIISFCIFIMIKFINKISQAKKKEEKEAKEEVKEIEENTKLLQEIRDLLKEKKK